MNRWASFFRPVGLRKRVSHLSPLRAKGPSTSQPKAKRACERRPGLSASKIIKPQRGGTTNNQSVPRSLGALPETWRGDGRTIRVGLKRGLSHPVGACSILSGRSQGGARSSLALGWLVAGRWPEASEPIDEGGGVAHLKMTSLSPGFQSTLQIGANFRKASGRKSTASAFNVVHRVAKPSPQ